MALLYCDGFDYYGTGQLSARGWNGAGLRFQSGTSTRFNEGQCLNFFSTSFCGRTLPSNAATIYIGFAFYSNSLISNQPIISFNDLSTQQFDMRLNAAGQFFFTQSNAQIGSASSYSLANMTWNYLEIGAVFATGTGGSITLRINGTVILSLTGISTSKSGNPYCNTFTYGTGSGVAITMSIDDLYVCDATTSVNNTFLGDVRVYGLVPSGAGASTQWTPNGASSNYQCVNSIPPGSDFISSSTPGQTDLYQMQTVPAAASILGVQVSYLAEKTDSGTRTIQSVVKSSSAQATGAQNNLGTSPQYFTDLFQDDPNTGSPWTLSAVNAVQVGVSEVA